MPHKHTFPSLPQLTHAAQFQQVVELNGYVIILVESRDGKIKLYGSPADKDNLEVADEILDVNERKLEDSPRAEVIKHIHEVRGIRGESNRTGLEIQGARYPSTTHTHQKRFQKTAVVH